MKAFLNERLWVPLNKETQELTKKFTLQLYKEDACSKCEYRPDRHCDVCDECPAYFGEYRLWRKKEAKSGKNYIGLPLGRRKLFKELIGNYEIVDQRGKTRFRNDIRFTRKLNEEQEPTVEQMLKKKYGILEAPPRSGKTVMATYIACKYGRKTLILANQHDFLQGFYDTIMGNDKTGVEPFTNVPDLQAKRKMPIVSFGASFEEIKHADIVLCTYQKFLSPKGQKLLSKIKSLFGTVIVDEVHRVAAHCYLKVVSRLNARMKFGLTGTVERKDKKDVLTDYVLGPVNARCEVTTLRPVVDIVETGVSTSYKYQQWTYAMNFLMKHKKRNELIVKHVIHDLKKGRSLVIPAIRVGHAKQLAQMINDKLGDKLATVFYGGQPKPLRKSIIEDARNGKVRVVVGMRQLVQLGINVPRWDTIYVISPISNPPNFHQETSRVRTPAPNKKEPLVKFFLDDFGPSKGCFRTCWWQTVKKEGFRVPPNVEAIAFKYLKKGGGFGASEEYGDTKISKFKRGF